MMSSSISGPESFLLQKKHILTLELDIYPLYTSMASAFMLLHTETKLHLCVVFPTDTFSPPPRPHT